MLKHVTLTGADDSINPRELLAIADEHPFVEWGILVGSHAGARFPSPGWLCDLVGQVVLHESNVRLALHVCGARLREMMDGYRPNLFSGCIDVANFARWQLNFHGNEVCQGEVDNMIKVMRDLQNSRSTPVETIVQLDGINDSVLDDFLAAGLRASGLYDRSHGGGVTPERWPAPNRRWEVGYAGGLGLDNVAAEIRKIYEVANGQRFWIDMETKLFTGRVFDLRICRGVLEEAKPFIGKPWQNKSVQ